MTSIKNATLDTIKSLLGKIFTRLHVSSLHNPVNEPIDKQCRDRFGKSWDETRACLMLQVQTFEFAPGRVLDPEKVARAIGLEAGTGNWMTDKYLGVLYLHFLRTPRTHGVMIDAEPGKVPVVQPVSLSGIFVDAAFEKVVKAIESGQQTEFLSNADELYWDLLLIASRVLPDEAEQVLTSHGL